MSHRPLHGSLAAKIIAWSFVPTLIILSIVALFVYQTYQRVLESQVFERDRQLTGLRAAQMAAQLADLADGLRTLAAVPDIARFEPAGQQIALAWAVDRLRAFDGGVLVVDASGRVTAADPRRLPAGSGDATGEVPVAELLGRQGEVGFSDVFSEQPGGLSVAVSAPVYDDAGRRRGLLIGIVRLRYGTVDPLGERLARAGAASLVDGASANNYYVADSQGRVLYHADPALRGLDEQLNPQLRALMLGQSGAAHTHGLLGDETLASYAPLPGTPWTVVVEDDWGALAAFYQGYERGLLALLLLALVLPALVVAAGVRRITRPIAELTQAVEQMAGGNLDGAVFDRPIVVRTGDELERLAGQFNLMSARLRELARAARASGSGADA